MILYHVEIPKKKKEEAAASKESPSENERPTESTSTSLIRDSIWQVSVEARLPIGECVSRIPAALKKSVPPFPSDLDHATNTEAPREVWARPCCFFSTLAANVGQEPIFDLH